MGNLSIKIKIADREYPIKAPASEEAKLRNAGKVINDKLRQFRAQFGIDDKQDLLAMVAIDCMVEKLQSDEEKTGVSTVIADKLNHLDDLLSSAL